jgi:hypothetical protein
VNTPQSLSLTDSSEQIIDQVNAHIVPSTSPPQNNAASSDLPRTFTRASITSSSSTATGFALATSPAPRRVPVRPSTADEAASPQRLADGTRYLGGTHRHRRDDSSISLASAPSFPSQYELDEDEDEAAALRHSTGASGTASRRQRSIGPATDEFGAMLESPDDSAAAADDGNRLATSASAGPGLRDRLATDPAGGFDGTSYSANSALDKRDRRDRIFADFAFSRARRELDLNERSGYTKTLSRRQLANFDRRPLTDKSSPLERPYTSMSRHPSLRSSRTTGHLRDAGPQQQPGDGSSMGVGGPQVERHPFSSRSGSGSGSSASLGRLKLTTASNAVDTPPSMVRLAAASAARHRPGLPQTFFDVGPRRLPDTFSPRPFEITSDDSGVLRGTVGYHRSTTPALSGQRSPDPSSISNRRELGSETPHYYGGQGESETTMADAVKPRPSTWSRRTRAGSEARGAEGGRIAETGAYHGDNNTNDVDEGGRRSFQSKEDVRIPQALNRVVPSRRYCGIILYLVP